VREGVDNGLLGSADGEVFFPHDLVREAVYADIAPGDRRALHRACARYIVGDGRSALAAATHFRASAVQDDEEAAWHWNRRPAIAWPRCPIRRPNWHSTRSR
jgi:hypothetical protein